jgi:hypothetical protein
MATYLGKDEATPTLGDVRVNINNPFFEQKSDVSYVISPELFTPEIENILHHPIISALEKITVLTQSKYDEIKNASALNPNILYLIQEEVKMQTTSMLKKIVLLSQEKYDSYKNNNTLDENILYLTPCNTDGGIEMVRRVPSENDIYDPTLPDGAFGKVNIRRFVQIRPEDWRAGEIAGTNDPEAFYIPTAQHQEGGKL